LAGEGKSTISRTVSLQWHKEQRLGASFFFSQSSGDASHAGKFVTSIAAQLVENVPILYQHICNAITERPMIIHQSLQDQWQHLILNPFSKLDEKDCHASYLLVVDGLDECNDDSIIHIILNLFAEARSLQTVRLRVFLTSTPEARIRIGLGQIPDTERQDFDLHSIPRSTVDKDIQRFLVAELSSDLGEQDITQLVWGAAGLFEWAAIASRFIRDGPIAEKRLSIILGGTVSTAVSNVHINGAYIALLQDVIRRLIWNASNLYSWAAISCGFVREGLIVKQWLYTPTSNSITPEDHLDWIYLTILISSLRPTFTRDEIEDFSSMVRDVLGSTVILFSYLSIKSLSRIIERLENEVTKTLSNFHAILVIPNDETHTFRLHHPSFRDFLLNKRRCRESYFWVDERRMHEKLAGSCIRLMKSLKPHICGLDAPGALVAEAGSSQVKQYLPPEVQYACLYWVRHFQKSGAQLRDNDQFHQFLQDHLLHWIEALGWMERIFEGINAIISLESFASVSSPSA
jgi:NACHT domain